MRELRQNRHAARCGSGGPEQAQAGPWLGDTSRDTDRIKPRASSEYEHRATVGQGMCIEPSGGLRGGNGALDSSSGSVHVALVGGVSPLCAWFCSAVEGHGGGKGSTGGQGLQSLCLSKALRFAFPGEDA